MPSSMTRQVSCISIDPAIMHSLTVVSSTKSNCGLRHYQDFCLVCQESAIWLDHASWRPEQSYFFVPPQITKRSSAFLQSYFARESIAPRSLINIISGDNCLRPTTVWNP